MAESVRDTVKRSIDEERSKSDVVVGLVDNVSGEPFKCGTCEYYDKGVCKNENPKLKDREVQSAWCCNLYDHAGMKTVVE